MNERFKYIWKATFEHKIIIQDKDDKYSGYNPNSSWNPSSFRDFQDYFEEHKDEIKKFELISKDEIYSIDFSNKEKPEITTTRYGRYGSSKNILLHKEKRPLRDIRVIYFRQCECEVKNGKFVSPRVLAYKIGYQGIDNNGNNRQKQITVI